MKLIYDIETNGLIDTVDTIWLVVTKNVDTNEVKTFLVLLMVGSKYGWITGIGLVLFYE